MSRFFDRNAHALTDPRLRLVGGMAVVAVLLALLQRTAFAPLPHGIDGFVGGLAIGLTLSTIIGWLMWR